MQNKLLFQLFQLFQLCQIDLNYEIPTLAFFYFMLIDISVDLCLLFFKFCCCFWIMFSSVCVL